MENVELKKIQDRTAQSFGRTNAILSEKSMGVGMHAGYLLGYPASHGCIRLPKEMAARFFQNVTIGTPVAIGQEVPWEYGPNPLIPERFAPLTSITER